MKFTFNPNDVHTEEALSSVSQAYRNEETVWREVAPLVDVENRSDKYYVFDEMEHYEAPDDRTAPNADAKEIVQKLSDDSYSVKDHALGAWVPVEAIEAADDPIRPEGRAVEGIRSRLELAHEKRVADRVFTAANHAAGYKKTLSGTSQWNDASSDPIEELLAALDVPLQRPNRLLLGADVWRTLRTHPSIIAAIFPTGGNAGTGGVMATAQALAEVLEIEQVIIGRARYNAAKQGQAGSLARIWGKHALLYYREQNPGIDTAAFAATFSETQSNIVRDFDPKKGVKGSVYVKDGWNEDVKIISQKSAYFLESVVA
jgi:hypothetical protein